MENDHRLDLSNFAAGWLAGIGQVLVGQPFDAVKIRLQTSPLQNDALRNLWSISEKATTPYAMHKFYNHSKVTVEITNSSLRCIKQMLKHEGLKSFYKGSTPPLLGIGLITAVQFSVRDRCSSLYGGMLAGLAGSVLVSPFELIRIRMQLSKETVSFLSTFLQTGIVGCYRGFASVVLRESIGMGAYFWTYDRIMRYCNNPLVAGSIAGIAFWSSIYPIDIVKSGMQSSTTKSYKVVVKKLWKMNGFFNGFLPCLARAIPVNAVSFFIYEQTRACLSV